MYEHRKQQGYNKNRGKNNQFRYRNNGQQAFTRNQQGQNTRNKNQYKPRVFVTPQQVNVDPYGCLTLINAALFYYNYNHPPPPSNQPKT